MEKGKKERERKAARVTIPALALPLANGENRARVQKRVAWVNVNRSRCAYLAVRCHFLCVYIYVCINIFCVETRHKMQHKYISVKRETEGLGLLKTEKRFDLKKKKKEVCSFFFSLLLSRARFFERARRMRKKKEDDETKE